MSFLSIILQVSVASTLLPACRTRGLQTRAYVYCNVCSSCMYCTCVLHLSHPTSSQLAGLGVFRQGHMQSFLCVHHACTVYEYCTCLLLPLAWLQDQGASGKGVLAAVADVSVSFFLVRASLFLFVSVYTRACTSGYTGGCTTGCTSGCAHGCFSMVSCQWLHVDAYLLMVACWCRCRSQLTSDDASSLPA